MTDLERRLRAALHAAAEQPPPGLMDAVLRRHRRHRVRVAASLVAVLAAAALAVPPVTGALRSEGRAGGGTPAVTPGGGLPSDPSRAVAHRRPVAAAGTVLSGCGGANLGAVGRNWRAQPGVQAGPLRFQADGHSSGPVRLYVSLAILSRLSPESVVVVRVAPAGRRYLRFLYGPSDSLNPGTRYTMRSGEAGVTFVACRPGQEIVPSSQITDYYGGYLVLGAHCVPVRVWVPGRARPIRIRLGACPGR